MKTYNLELTNTQAYFLKAIIGCSSTDSMKNYIKDNIKNSIVGIETVEKLIDLCNERNSWDKTDIIFDIWYKLEKFDIEYPFVEKIKKYQYAYFYQGKWELTAPLSESEFNISSDINSALKYIRQDYTMTEK